MAGDGATIVTGGAEVAASLRTRGATCSTAWVAVAEVGTTGTVFLARGGEGRVACGPGLGRARRESGAIFVVQIHHPRIAKANTASPAMNLDGRRRGRRSW